MEGSFYNFKFLNRETAPTSAKAKFAYAES